MEYINLSYALSKQSSVDFGLFSSVVEFFIFFPSLYTFAAVLMMLSSVELKTYEVQASLRIEKNDIE